MIPNDLIFPHKKQHHTAVFGWEKNISSIGSITIFYSSNMLKPYWFSVKNKNSVNPFSFSEKYRLKAHMCLDFGGFEHGFPWFPPSLPMPFWMDLHFPWPKNNPRDSGWTSAWPSVHLSALPREAPQGGSFHSLWDQKWRETGGKSWKLMDISWKMMEIEGHIMENDGIWWTYHGKWWKLREISWKMMEILGKYHVKYDAKWRETWKW